MKLKAFNQRDFTSSFSMEANLEKSSSQNRGITPSSSPKPIILNNNDFKQIKLTVDWLQFLINTQLNIHTLHHVFFKKQKKNFF